MLVILIPMCIQAIKVVTSPWIPLMSCEVGSTNVSLAQGYYKDLLISIQESLPGLYEWTFECLSFTDMISKITSGEADVAIGCISITTERIKHMRFSTPTYESGIILVTIKSNLSMLWLFFEPFDFSLWCSILIVIIVNAHMLWMAEQNPFGPIHESYLIGIIESLQHSVLSLFLIGDLKLHTISGRLIQLCYWFMGLMLIVCYLSRMSAILSIDWQSSSIKSYEDIRNKDIGSFDDYLATLKLYEANVINYSWSFESSQKMINDLKVGKIDAAALPYPFAVYLSKINCDFLIIGQRFVNDYFAIAFSSSIEEEIYKAITQINLELYLSNYHRKLENKFVLVSDTDACDYSADIPLGVHEAGGLWIAILAAIVIALIVSALYKKKLNKLELVVDYKDIYRKNSILHEAAEAELLSKFEIVLRSSENKLIQKTKDFQQVLDQSYQTSEGLREILQNFK